MSLTALSKLQDLMLIYFDNINNNNNNNNINNNNNNKTWKKYSLLQYANNIKNLLSSKVVKLVNFVQ